MASSPSKHAEHDNETDIFESELVVVDDLRATDVVLCQGCSSGIVGNVLQGNVNFRSILSKLKDAYTKADEKGMVVKKIVSAVAAQDPPGRFLESVVDSTRKQRFVIVSPSRCCEKLDQCLFAERTKQANASNNCSACKTDHLSPFLGAAEDFKNLDQIRNKSELEVDCNALSKLSLSSHKDGALHSGVNQNIKVVVKKEDAKSMINGQQEKAMATENIGEIQDSVAQTQNEETINRKNAPNYLSLKGGTGTHEKERLENRKPNLLVLEASKTVTRQNEGISAQEKEHNPHNDDKSIAVSNCWFEEEENNKHHHGQPNGFFNDVPPHFTALYSGQLICHCHEYMKLKDAFRWQHSCAAMARGVRLDIPFPLPPRRVTTRNTGGILKNNSQQQRPNVLDEHHSEDVPPKEDDSNGMEQINTARLEMQADLPAANTCSPETSTPQQQEQEIATHQKEKDLRLAALTLFVKASKEYEKVVVESNTRFRETAGQLSSERSEPDPNLEQQQPLNLLVSEDQEQFARLSISSSSSEPDDAASIDNCKGNSNGTKTGKGGSK